jgi:hypothetical protein
MWYCYLRAKQDPSCLYLCHSDAKDIILLIKEICIFKI